jgi:hypothetical protein
MLVPFCPIKALQATIPDIENDSQICFDRATPIVKCHLQNLIQNSLKTREVAWRCIDNKTQVDI